MSERLYLEDPLCGSFAARVISRQEQGEQWWLELDRTCFYVEGGGQPSDQGEIADARVLRVFENGDAVWHVVDRPVTMDEVWCTVDMDLRRDFSVQHTGQHILSQAYWRLFGAATSSFHLTEKSVSIDLSVGDLTDEQVAEGEALSNRIIRAGLTVSAAFYHDYNELPEELRKNPVVEGPIRLVSIGDFDVCPCAGTHVESASEVQLIKVLATERTRGRIRVHFVCGDRALREFASRIASDNALAQLVSAPYQEQAAAVERLLSLEKENRRERTRLSREVMQYRATQARPHTTYAWGEYFEFPDWAEDADDAKFFLAALCAARQPAVVVLATATDPARLFISSSSDKDAGALLRRLYTRFSGKGGGSSRAAQGSLPAGEVAEALSTLRGDLEE